MCRIQLSMCGTLQNVFEFYEKKVNKIKRDNTDFFT